MNRGRRRAASPGARYVRGAYTPASAFGADFVLELRNVARRDLDGGS
jgi:hypothetical protein